MANADPPTSMLEPPAPSLVLGVDPSSSRTGYALLDSLEPAGLIEAGYVTPRKIKDDAIYRIETMIDDLAGLVRNLKPAAVVIEITSGKVGRRHNGGGAGLAIYGMAVGMMLADLRRIAADIEPPADLISVRENDWTAGVPKRSRLATLAAIYPSYAEALAGRKDGGGDAGDAIGLARWWLAQRPITSAARTARSA